MRGLIVTGVVIAAGLLIVVAGVADLLQEMLTGRSDGRSVR